METIVMIGKVCSNAIHNFRPCIAFQEWYMFNNGNIYILVGSDAHLAKHSFNLQLLGLRLLKIMLLWQLTNNVDLNDQNAEQ